MEKVYEEKGYDPNTGGPYRAMEWKHEGRKIEVTIDGFGVHARVDEGKAVYNLSDLGLLRLLQILFVKGK